MRFAFVEAMAPGQSPLRRTQYLERDCSLYTVQPPVCSRDRMQLWMVSLFQLTKNLVVHTLSCLTIPGHTAGFRVIYTL